MSRARNSFPFTIQGRPADAERVPVAELRDLARIYRTILAAFLA